MLLDPAIFGAANGAVGIPSAARRDEINVKLAQLVDEWADARSACAHLSYPILLRDASSTKLAGRARGIGTFRLSEGFIYCAPCAGSTGDAAIIKPDQA